MGKHQKRLRYPISQKSRQDTFVLPSSQEKLPIFEQVGSRYILYCIATLGLKLLTVENMYQVFTLLTYLHTIFLRLRWFQFSTIKINHIFLILFSNLGKKNPFKTFPQNHESCIFLLTTYLHKIKHKIKILYIYKYQSLRFFWFLL